ncbi:hypothetical protein yrohd0001_3980 [Yersinia rohdei ATCC 43380]|nr:hypothetical protein yrohd0001_3980 [Yersinia rohdei ATCC 43380]
MTLGIAFSAINLKARMIYAKDTEFVRLTISIITIKEAIEIINNQND